MCGTSRYKGCARTPAQGGGQCHAMASSRQGTLLLPGCSQCTAEGRVAVPSAPKNSGHSLHCGQAVQRGWTWGAWKGYLGAGDFPGSLWGNWNFLGTKPQCQGSSLDVPEASFPRPIFGTPIPYAYHGSDPLPQDFMALLGTCSRLHGQKLAPLHPSFLGTYMTEMLKELGM